MSTPTSSTKQSRYSFFRLRTESPGFFYPPLTPEYSMPSTSQSSQPAAHPYQLATGLASPSPDPETGAGGMQSAQDEVLSRPGIRDIDKEPATSTSENAHAHAQPYTPPARSARPRTPQMRSPILEKYKLPIYLLLFLPIPPLLSLIYCLIGHSIMRHAQPAPNPAWLPTFLSTAGAAATGGIILSLPLALLLYLLLYPAPRQVAPADFFEDDDESLFTRIPAIKYTVYSVCFVIALFMGAIAGPLGVTCVAGSEGGALSPRNAAVAGLVGGVIICGGVCVIAGLGVGVWLVAVTTKREEGGGSD
ncbi:hypothetical protein BDQ17DRAFT_1359801 [Cyathus striatus]|nr:hypothetical protein BDQ17DRAFT_1359801 [Cyathus striatus]